MIKIYPKSKMFKETHPTLTWEGYFAPCCMVSGTPFEDIKNLLGDKISQWHITNGTVDEINRSEASYLFEKSFETNPIPQCVKICGKKIEDSVGEDGNIQRLDVRLK